MNKKGQVTIALTVGVLIVIGVIILLIMLGTGFFLAWLTSHLMMLIGGALIILTLVFGLKNMSSNPSKGVIALFVGLIGVGIILIVLSSSGIMQTAYTGDFVKPMWARLECSPADTFVTPETGTIVSGEQIYYKCNYFTDECRVSVNIVRTGITESNVYLELCDAYGNNCVNKNTWYSHGTYTLPNLKRGTSYKLIVDWFIPFTHIKSSTQATITGDYKVWGLYRFFGGAKTSLRSGSCDIISSDKSKILAGDVPASNKLYIEGTGEGTKWINYVDDWVYGPATNVFTHPTYGVVYCSGGAIYSIIKVSVADGTIKSLDPSYNKQAPDGTVYNGLGNRITSVECCPNEPNCGDDFRYKPTPTLDCPSGSNLQCLGAGGFLPINNKQYVYYTCINSQCVKSAPVTVECTENSACPAGQICDVSTTNYGHCKVPVGTEWCGDGKCNQLTESAVSCPADCGTPNECSWYQESYSTTKKDCKILGLFWCSDKPYSGCKTAGWVYLVILGAIIIVLIVVIVLILKPSRKRRKR